MQRKLRNIKAYSTGFTGGVEEVGTFGRIQVWRNVIMELKDTYYRNAKTKRRTKKTGEKKTAGCAGSQVSTSCLSCVAAVAHALIRFLAEFSGVFMYV